MAAKLIFLEAKEAEAKEGAEKIMNSMDVEEQLVLFNSLILRQILRNKQLVLVILVSLSVLDMSMKTQIIMGRFGFLGRFILYTNGFQHFRLVVMVNMICNIPVPYN